MGRISAGVGLISGLKIDEIVTKLLAVEARPLTLIEDRLAASKAQQTALLDLSATLLSLKFSTTALSSSNILEARTATSSQPSLIAATAQTNAPLGTYLVRPTRLAQTQQLISTGFVDTNSTPVGAGTWTIKLGGLVNPTTSLEVLNGGQGVERGRIRITDRSGASEVIDLGSARTIADVVEAINQASTVRVEASVRGDSLVLTDLTGLATSNLSVQEVDGGSTAADLGLAASVAAATLAGTDIVRLAGTLRLGYLNDNNGVRQAPSVDDFRITLADASTLDIDLGSAATLSDVLDAINQHASNGGKLTAAIDAGGDRLVLTDHTAGAGTLAVTALNQSQTAQDLGILGTAQAAGVLTGSRILAGLETVLLKDTSGGSGIGTLGQVQFTARDGATATVDFSNAETLDDVIAGINAAGIGLTASVNKAGNGLSIVDTTGAAASNLVIADVGAGTVAADLNLAADVAAWEVQSGDLNVRYISENTRLDRLNGGAGIQRGKFRITDSLGNSSDINLTNTAIQTIGDVLVALNTSGVGVTARINDTGDGILLEDTAGGGGQLIVTELGGGTAASLRLLGSGSGQIDGAFRYQVVLDADDTLTELVTKLADSGAPASAVIVNDGSSTAPYRLLLSSNRPGEAGRLIIDTSLSGVSLSTLTPASDAVLEIGSYSGSSLLFTSSSNSFKQVLPGLSLDIAGTSAAPVTITVSQNSTSLSEALGQFVDGFNDVAASIAKLTAFDSLTGKRGVLQADRTVLEIQTALFNLVTGQSGSAANAIQSFGQLGVTLSDGTLSIDETILSQRLAADPEAVEDFLAAAEVGLAERLEKLLERITEVADGTITRRINTLSDHIADLEARTEAMNARLETKRDRLLKQFLNMERALAEIQSQGSALAQLAALAPLAASSKQGS